MSAYNPHIHHRRSVRLKGYDYSKAGLYFITICVKNRECLFGHIKDGEMILNDAGQLVENEWLKIPQRFTNTQLHEYVVMPNHFHAILQIVPVGATLVVAPDESGQPDDPGQPQGIAPTDIPSTDKTLGDMVGAFQSIVTVKYIRGVKNKGWKPFDKKLLQRNYYEHIIRNEKAYRNISNYIINNPQKWDDDRFNGKNNNKGK